ncbi:hypothetical protein [Brevibacterium aurantiacum]|uniref:hypothetical protein n=1 Tax=Brevibacterium aurantiacum TaxID=273384 RepID=UPI000050FB9B|nr:hypothetical protein [Brevibacterium aurantiacum]
MNCDRHLGFKPYCKQCANDRFETLEWFFELGETWSSMIVRRAGFPSIAAAERAAYRAGRQDLMFRLQGNTGGVALGV